VNGAKTDPSHVDARIHPDLASLARPVAELSPDPRNARLHDRRNTDAIKASYQAHGQLKPVVVQRVTDAGQAMVIRAGNGSLAAVKELGWTHLACVVVDMSDRDAIAFALRDNRSAELAEWDWQVVATELAGFDQVEGFDVGTLGWSESEVAPLRETTWFKDAQGQLEDHSRDPKPDAGAEKRHTVKIEGQDAADFNAAMAVMLERFPDARENLGHAVGRMARHYLATLTHSQAPKN
jgi:hypothetical protein